MLKNIAQILNLLFVFHFLKRSNQCLPSKMESVVKYYKTLSFCFFVFGFTSVSFQTKLKPCLVFLYDLELHYPIGKALTTCDYLNLS